MPGNQCPAHWRCRKVCEWRRRIRRRNSSPRAARSTTKRSSRATRTRRWISSSRSVGLPPGSHILDMGCGTGRHAVELARRGYRVTGVDIAAGMLDGGAQSGSHSRRGGRMDRGGRDALHDRRAVRRGALPLRRRVRHPQSGRRPRRARPRRPPRHRAALQPGAPLILTTLNAFARLRELTDDDHHAR